MALGTVLTHVVAVLRSYSISVFVCPFVASAGMHTARSICMRVYSLVSAIYRTYVVLKRFLHSDTR